MRATSTFFSSRWVERPAYVRELDDGGLPSGFRAAGVAAGIKPSGAPDLALLVCDSEDAVSAARFTRSGVQAAPVAHCREHCDLQRLRAVIANSGNANAVSGPRGAEAATRMQAAGAAAAGVVPQLTAVASTGVIGVPLPIDAVERGARDAASALARDGDDAFAEAIRTTDAFAKRVSLDVELSRGTVRLSAQAKGAGMISPDFATLLCFVQTDARMSAATADLLLGVTVQRSFDRISVDGELSTNDTAILIASGASGVDVLPESDDELRFGEALDAVLRQLALRIVADGEGAARIARVVVRGGSGDEVENVARAIANSPLVKTALHGGDPNWGRIAQAVGAAMPDAAPVPLDIAIEGIEVCNSGMPVTVDQQALEAAVARDEVEYLITLPGFDGETEVYFSDLSHDYVSINAEYTS